MVRRILDGVWTSFTLFGYDMLRPSWWGTVKVSREWDPAEEDEDRWVEGALAAEERDAEEEDALNGDDVGRSLRSPVTHHPRSRPILGQAAPPLREAFKEPLEIEATFTTGLAKI